MPTPGAEGQILLMGHGSRDLDGAREFVALVDAVREAAGPTPVEAGFLEFAGPVISSIQAAFFYPQSPGLERQSFNINVGRLGNEGAGKQFSCCPATFLFPGFPKGRTHFVRWRFHY